MEYCRGQGCLSRSAWKEEEERDRKRCGPAGVWSVHKTGRKVRKGIPVQSSGQPCSCHAFLAMAWQSRVPFFPPLVVATQRETHRTRHDTTR